MLARQPQPVFIHSWSILLNDLMVVVVILAPVEVVVESKEARDSTVKTLESLLGSYWSQEGEQTSSQHQNSFASTSLHEVCGITYSRRRRRRRLWWIPPRVVFHETTSQRKN